MSSFIDFKVHDDHHKWETGFEIKFREEKKRSLVMYSLCLLQRRTIIDARANTSKRREKRII